MHPKCTKPKKLSVLHSWRTTKRRKLPSQAKSRTIFQRLLQRRSLRTSWVFSFLRLPRGEAITSIPWHPNSASSESVCAFLRNLY